MIAAPESITRVGARAIGTFGTPLRVAATVGATYMAVLAVALAHHGPGDFALVGSYFLTSPGTSEVIRSHATATSSGGYDGQFALFIALDPRHAAASIDKPVYRYSHILYPALARALAGGRPSLVPWAMLAVGLLALLVGTFAIAAILRRNGLPPQLALLYGFFPGVFVSFERETCDLLAYSLAALGVLLLRFGNRRRLLLACVAFAAAGLARESTLLFPAVLAVAHVLSGDGERHARLRRAAILAAAAAAPYAILRVLLRVWLGNGPAAPGGLAPFPFAGLVEQRPWDLSVAVCALAVVVPAVLVGVVAAAAALRGQGSVMLAVLGLQLAIFVVFLPDKGYLEYYGAGRLQVGTVAAALCALPSLRAAHRLAQPVLVAATTLALTPAVVFAALASAGRIPI